jgi:hypothetical protein
MSSEIISQDFVESRGTQVARQKKPSVFSMLGFLAPLNPVAISIIH